MVKDSLPLSLLVVQMSRIVLKGKRIVKEFLNLAAQSSFPFQETMTFPLGHLIPLGNTPGDG